MVRSRRTDRGISREKLAREVGVSTSTIVRLERDNKLPNAHALVRVAARLDLSVEALLTSAGARGERVAS